MKIICEFLSNNCDISIKDIDNVIIKAILESHSKKIDYEEEDNKFKYKIEYLSKDIKKKKNKRNSCPGLMQSITNISEDIYVRLSDDNSSSN